MARIRVEVVGRPLSLKATYAVGERLFLDTDEPRHREVLERGWARRLPDAPGKAVEAPPADRMVASAPNKAVQRKETAKA